MTENKVFVSYRRRDSAAEASLLTALLRQRFGRGRIFLDTAAIEPGEIWPERLLEAVRSSDVVLAVMGASYASVTREGSQVPSIFEHRDWVRLELTEAIRSRKRIVPVLVNDARLPDPSEVPEDLHPVLDCQAFRFRVENAESDADTLGDFVAPTVKLSWEKFDHAIANLAHKLSLDVDVFVGVGVGGTIVAATLAGNLSKSFLCVDRDVKYDDQKRRVPSLLDSGVTSARRELVKGKRVVVVSAEIVSGATTELATELMEQLDAASIATCCIYAYEGRTIRADYFYRERRSDGIVQMPWRILRSYTNPDDLVRPAAVENNDDT